MSKSKRVTFTFDERSLDTLEDMTREGQFSSMAETVRESLQISRALQSQAKKGYTEITVRNPDTDEERVIIIPHFESLKKSEQ